MNDDIFILVEAAKLSLQDDFLQYCPQTDKEELLKTRISEVIQRGVKDFWKPKFDPSFTEEGNEICYVAGRRPAVLKNCSWWVKTAQAFNRERSSRLGTKDEYVAFLGTLIKQLVDEGWEVSEAWHSVCNDSDKLGYYVNKGHDKDFQPAGSRGACGHFDLANTGKILVEDERYVKFYCADVGYTFSDVYPLAAIHSIVYPWLEQYDSVGWIVLEK